MTNRPGIDYSKWDNLSLYSDSEDSLEERVEPAIVSQVHEDSRVGEVQASAGIFNIVDGKSKVAFRGSSRIEMQPCSGCSSFFPSEKLLLCSRCKQRTYCSKSCQNQDWKHHKPYCFSTSDELETLSIPTEKALHKLFETFLRYPDIQAFAVSSSPKLSDARSPRFLGTVSIATVARRFFDEDGPGILVLALNDCADCEDLVITLSLLVQGTLSTKLPTLPPVAYAK